MGFSNNPQTYREDRKKAETWAYNVIIYYIELLQ